MSWERRTLRRSRPGAALAACSVYWRDRAPDKPRTVKKADKGSGECQAWVVDYKLTKGSKLTMTDTPMGARDGEHAIQLGSAKLRFASDGKSPGTRARGRQGDPPASH